MKTTGALLAFLSITLLGVSPPSPAQQSPGMVWVDPHTLPSGEVIQGYRRPPFRKGFYWVAGKKDENGNWLPGHWHPVGRPPENKIWAPSYWNGTVWVAGYWRPSAKPGCLWIGPCWENGGWREGYWRAYKGGHPWRSRFPRPLPHHK